MKNYSILMLTFLCSISVHAQFQTITVPTNAPIVQGQYAGGAISVPTNSVAHLKSFVGAGQIYLQVNAGGTSFQIPGNYLSLADTPVVIAGPASVQIQQSTSSGPGALATFYVEPGPFPPNRTVTVGAYAGNVQVTMQMSTDLVNWTPAVNAQVYTNSPDARFFRIQLVTNAAP